jgi:hypothetical protein
MSDQSTSYSLLTPHGAEQKAQMTLEFLQIKVREYECLRTEIEEPKREAEQNGSLENHHE